MEQARRSPETVAIPTHAIRTDPAGMPAGSAETLSAPAAGLEQEVRRLRVALEDVVALAHSGMEARHRVIQMQRRAIAALTGVDAETSASRRRTSSSEVNG